MTAMITEDMKYFQLKHTMNVLEQQSLPLVRKFFDMKNVLIKYYQHENFPIYSIVLFHYSHPQIVDSPEEVGMCNYQSSKQSVFTLTLSKKTKAGNLMTLYTTYQLYITVNFKKP